MSRFVVSLDSVRQSDAARVGGKAAVLGTLRDAGFPVPAGLCLTTEAFNLALAPFRERVLDVLRAHDLSTPVGVSAAADAVREALSKLAVPADAVAELRAALPSIASADTPFAVRSSATAEDRVDTSFAGQYATVLGVRGEPAILDAIATCWQSFFAANALTARASAGGGWENESMAVLIQPVVDSECAGICFTVDPVRHRRDLVVVDAAWGLGIGAVDGAVATDTYWVLRRNANTDDRRVVEKTEQIALAPDGGVRRVAVPEDRRRAACLPEPWLRRVAQFGLAAEFLLKRPQDVEWAIGSGQVWILQSRPITTLPPELATVPDFPIDWDNDEDRRTAWFHWEPPSRPLLLPLQIEIGEAFQRSTIDSAHFKGEERTGRGRIFNGRSYTTPVATNLREGDRRVRQAAFDDLALRLRDQGQTLWEYWAPEIIAATERLSAFDRNTDDGAKLAEHLEDAFGAFLRHWTLHWLMWSRTNPLAPFHAAFAAVIGLPEKEAEAEAAKFLEGGETMLTRLIDELYALAEIARAEPRVAALVAAPPPDVGDRLAALPEAAAFRARLEDFLKVFGDRIGVGFGSDATILNRTWREELPLVFSMVAPYLDPNVESPAAARERARRERDEQLDALCARSSNAEAVAELRRWLPFARKVATRLEDHNHYIDQLAYGQLRLAILAAARWLVNRGALRDVDDVFWLRRDEIVAALRAETPPSFEATIAERRAQYAEWEKLEPPPVIGTPDARLEPRPPLRDELTEGTPDGATHLSGQGASPGRHRGRARIVPGDTTIPPVRPGDVLVAENAGPLWTPIFPILGALVLDQGVLTQHAATTAREYGVPAVIRTGNATRRIPDGAWVTVDGTAGTVEIEPPDES